MEVVSISNSIVTDILISTIVFLSGFLFIDVFRRYLFISRGRATVIYLWHTMFSVVYMLMSYYTQTDSYRYYLSALDPNYNIVFGTGSEFIVFLTYCLANILYFPYLALFLFFGLFGTLGLLFIDSSLKLVTQHNSVFIQRLATLVVFLPSMSFWTSSLGKDSLAFLSIGLLVWSFVYMKSWSMYIASIFIMFLVRPHIATLLFIGLYLGCMVLNKKVLFKFSILKIILLFFG